MISRALLPITLISLCSVVIVSSAPIVADAQNTVRAAQRAPRQRRFVYGGGAVGQLTPVQATQQTLRNAAQVLESALPIYDGHRHRAIELTRLAEQELKEAIASAGSVRTGRTSGKRVRPTQRAAGVRRGQEVAGSRYGSQQVMASNARMQQGIQLLQQGIQQLQSLGRDPGNHVSDSAEYAGLAAQAANQGLQFTAGRR